MLPWIVALLIVLGLQTLYRGPYLPKDGPCVFPAEDEPEHSGCVEGFASLWRFDGATDVVTLDSVWGPRKICHYPWYNRRPTVCFVLRKDDEIVWTNAIYWRLVSGCGHCGDTDEVFRDLPCPVALESINNYQVWKIRTNALLGAGPMVEPE